MILKHIEVQLSSAIDIIQIRLLSDQTYLAHKKASAGLASLKRNERTAHKYNILAVLFGCFFAAERIFNGI